METARGTAVVTARPMLPADLPWMICLDAARLLVLSSIAYLLIAVWCVARF